MRNALSCPVTSPATHVSTKWLVSGMLGLMAALLCVSPRAAVTQPDSPGASRVKSRQGKNRKSATQNRKKPDTEQHWQKKQPFAAIANGKESQASAKQSSKKTRRDMADYRFMNNVPESGKTWENGHNSNLASSVFTQKGNSLSSAYPQKSASVFRTNTKEPGTVNADNNGYAMGPARFSMSYEKSQDTTSRVARFMSGKTTPDIATNYDIVETRQNQPNLQLGMEYATGNGRVNASVNYVKLKDTKGVTSGTNGTTGSNNNDLTDLKTIAIGYTYDVSDRTSFYGMVARTEYEREAMAGYMRGNGSDEDSVTGVQFGMTHKF